MAHSDERKQGVLDILHTKSGGNASKCARLTGVDRKTILKWEKESGGKEEDENENENNTLSADIFTNIETLIIRRVKKIINSCSDPKKLVDTYEAIARIKQKGGGNKESLFDIIKNKLGEE